MGTTHNSSTALLLCVVLYSSRCHWWQDSRITDKLTSPCSPATLATKAQLSMLLPHPPPHIHTPPPLSLSLLHPHLTNCRGSWTYGEVSLTTPEEASERRRIYTNLHAVAKPQLHHWYLDDPEDPLLRSINAPSEGAEPPLLVVWRRSQFPGWYHHSYLARVTATYAFV